MDEGDMFTDRDVLRGQRVCVIGTTLDRELFQGESPVGKDIRIQNVSFRVVGVLSRKGANMMGMDQDDIVLAPWTTIKYRVSGARTAGAKPPPPRAPRAAASQHACNNLYPGTTSLYPVPSAMQTGRHAAAGALHQRRLDPGQGGRPPVEPGSHRPDHRACCASGIASAPTRRTTSTSAT